MALTLDMPIAAASTSTGESALYARRWKPSSVALLFATLIGLQCLGYLILGTGRAGMAFSEVLLIVHNVLAAACAWIAFRRARSAAAIFWFLFLVTLLILLIPTLLIAVQTTFGYAAVSAATWRVLFCLYGTPILMMLFLPVSEREGRVRSEVYLDLFQVTIVAGLAFYVFFYLPLQRMLPDDALLRNLDLSNLESIFLMAVILFRLRMAHTRQAKDLLLRLGVFVLFCALVTFIGNDIDAHHLAAVSAWWDLGWALPYVAAGLVALTFDQPAQAATETDQHGFASFLGINLMLVAVLLAINLLTASWQNGRGTLLTNLVMGISLFAFALRLALTQYRQHQEILQRKHAQQGLTQANEMIANLLDEARAEAGTNAQIAQLANLLQACTSRQEIFAMLPDCLSRLFPNTSGSVSVLNASRTRAEVVARWGTAGPLHRPLSPKPESSSAMTGLPAARVVAQSVPLMANGEALGIIEILANETDSATGGNAFNRQTQIAYSVSEPISATIAQADLREALRAQAIRDPLTGLFNRRYLEDALQREIQRARRRCRALSVLLLDIDHFKRFNDTYGHAAGDHALILVGETLANNVRAEDYACRYGGEEFLVILPECSLDQAAARAEEIRKCLKNLYTEQEGELPIEITASIGVAELYPAPDRADLLLKRADDALYQAKHAGRDRVVTAPSAPSLVPVALPASTAP